MMHAASLARGRPISAHKISHANHSRTVTISGRRAFHGLLTRSSSEGAEGVISGEWPATWSLLEYEDVLQFYERRAARHADTHPQSRLKDFMIKADKLITCGPEDSLEGLRATGVFNRISGLPVVRNDGVLLGIISHKDLNKPGTRVADVMTSSPIAARPTDTSSAAACLMLKYKVHRIPVVDKQKKCVGIVTRSDVFTALAVDAGVNTNVMEPNMLDM